MKKLTVLMTIILLCSVLFPGTFWAEGTEKNEDQTKKASEEAVEDEYNEFGIKKGTMVNGEDISKLSEEELQYIPEGWRDGVFEEAHAHEEAGAMSKSAVTSAATKYQNVNDYIRKNKFKTAKLENDYKSHFPIMEYRTGYGEVEGVVAHETANPNSNIVGEISHMSGNYKNAFVHAFIDHERAIEIHPTDYSAWGAGRYGNERYVHVELVQVPTFDMFARSINNYSAYIASVLYKYNLGVSTAKKAANFNPKKPEGTGTLWSHKDVATILGGTTHVDPHSYFAKWGYNWSEFVELVNEKYKELSVSKVKEAKTSLLGHIRSSSVRIYPNLDKQNVYKIAGEELTNAVYYIKKEAVMSGQRYYLLSKNPSSTTGVVGWAKATDISAKVHVGVDKTAKTFYVKGTGSAYTKAWGGSKNYFYKSLKVSTGKKFTVNLTEKVGDVTWYRGVVNGVQVWIEAKHVTAAKLKDTSKLGHIRSAKARIYSDLNNLSSYATSSDTYTHAVYYIKKEAELEGVLYYLLSKNPSSTTGVVGWAKAADVSAKAHAGVDKTPKIFYAAGTGSAYTKAWGGSKDYFFQKLAASTGQEFKVNLTEKVGDTIWYRGILNGKQVWIESKHVSAVKMTNVSQLGHIRSANVKLYSDIADLSSYTTASTTYTHAVYYIKKEAELKGVAYYLLSKNPSSTTGVVGWAKASDINAQKHLSLNKTAKTVYFKGTGKAYSKAWGGSKDLVQSNLASYANQAFSVNLTEKVGGVIWYRGVLNGKTAWVNSKEVSEIAKTATSKLGHIKSGSVAIYPDLDRLSASISAAGYTNSVYYIKREAVLDGEAYYLLSQNPSSTTGLVGWAKASDISSHAHAGKDKQAKTFRLKGTGSAFTKAWGGSKDYVQKSLTAYKNKEFKVNLTETVGNNTWYRGVLDGKTAWIHSAYLSKAS